MLSRETFVAELITLLQEKEKENGGYHVKNNDHSVSLFHSATLSTTRNMWDDARIAYANLQYDYPIVEDVHVHALNRVYHVLTQESGNESLAREFAISMTMIDGIVYLNDGAKPTRGSQATAILAATLLLHIPLYCLTHLKTDAIARTLLSRLYPNPSSLKIPNATVGVHSEMLEQWSNPSLSCSAVGAPSLNEVYAEEEGPDDLHLVYETSPAIHQSSVSLSCPQLSQPIDILSSLRYLASQTYSSMFSLLTAESWIDHNCDLALLEIIYQWLSLSQEDNREWEGYLFLLRDQLLRFPSVSTRSLIKLNEIILQQAGTTLVFSMQVVTEQRLFAFFRVLAQLAVSQEYTSSTARRPQHMLATNAIVPLFPIMLQILQHQAVAPSSSFRNDMIMILLQLLHFVLSASSPLQYASTVNKLHEHGLLRALVVLIPFEEENATDCVWLSLLLRLLGRCALWNQAVALYVHQIPRIIDWMTRALETELLSAEAFIMWIAVCQHDISLTLPPYEWWELFKSFFPLTCTTYLVSMRKMSDAMFVISTMVDVLETLRPKLRQELQRHLQEIYKTRFTTVFEYPSYSHAVVLHAPPSLVQEPEPSPTTMEDDSIPLPEERGQAEALQFQTFRNRLRQSIKSILLDQTSAKLD